MPRVLITGAAGFIGMHTSIRFLEEGWEVIGIDNLNDYYSVSLKEDRLKQIKMASEKFDREFSFYQEDLNSDIWDEFDDLKIDSLVHLAAQAGVRYSIENPMAYLESNILGFQKVIEFVLKKNIDRFLYASSSSVYGKNSKQPFSESEPCDSPESYYAATKRANELMACSYSKTQGLNSIGLRFFTVYGPWGRPDMAPAIFVRSALNKKTISLFNNGNQTRDFTYINDIVNGIFLCVLNYQKAIGATIFNIGKGTPISLFHFVKTIEEITETEISKKLVPAQLGDVEATWSDISKIQKLFGYIPRTDLKTGVQSYVNWYKTYYI